MVDRGQTNLAGKKSKFKNKQADGQNHLDDFITIHKKILGLRKTFAKSALCLRLDPQIMHNFLHTQNSPF